MTITLLTEAGAELHESVESAARELVALYWSGELVVLAPGLNSTGVTSVVELARDQVLSSYA